MNALAVATGVLALAFSAWRIFRRLRFFLHIHQLEGYRAGPYLRWLAGRPFDAVLRKSHMAGALVLSGLLWLDLPDAAALGLWAMAFASSRRYRRDQPKKPLAATPRLLREAVAAVGVTGLIVLGIAGPGEPGSRVIGVLAGLGMADLLAPLAVALGGLVMAPVESSIREGFKRQARARLSARPDLTIVAVTGSYGKTSVKFAIAEVLSQRFQVLATRGSFNTPMGICRVINDDLRNHHQVLILEMGIRHPGDIAELCAIARPDIAVVTGIGLAHLESMGSREAIAREKGSLLRYLRPGGRAVLNADDEFHDSMAEGTPHLSVSASGRPADLVASGVRFGPDGTRFQVQGANGETARVAMTLLGRHHIGNALLALGVGRLMGVRLRAAARALARQQPVEHRLSLREEGGLLILDDAFNSNPVGARNAVEVLEQFAPRQRLVVTPGMVELGNLEFEQNRGLGVWMADRVDHAILVGPARTAPISAGLRDAGMPPERIHVVGTLFEARERVRGLAQPGDVVLYENDLPDQYTEA